MGWGVLVWFWSVGRRERFLCLCVCRFDLVPVSHHGASTHKTNNNKRTRTRDRPKPQEVDGMKPEEALAIIEQGIKKPPKPRRVAPTAGAPYPAPVLDRGLQLLKRDAAEADGAVVEVVPKATERL
jgi:hypothetical protein